MYFLKQARDNKPSQSKPAQVDFGERNTVVVGVGEAEGVREQEWPSFRVRARPRAAGAVDCEYE